MPEALFYGSGTALAVRSFQKKNGLTQTGTADAAMQQLLQWRHDFFRSIILFYVKNIAYPITPSNADNSFLSKVVDSLAQTINHLF